MSSTLNYFDSSFIQLLQRGRSSSQAAEEVMNAYLDGKPGRTSKKPLNRTELFWQSEFLGKLTASDLSSDPFILALARYFAQEEISSPEVIACILRLAPDSVLKAIRYSNIVLKSGSLKWIEIKELAKQFPGVLDDQVKVCESIQRHHRDRLKAVESAHKKLAKLTVLELFSYISLFAFQSYMSDEVPVGLDGEEIEQEQAWESINQILIEKLKRSKAGAIELNELSLGRSLQRHLSPLLFPSESAPLSCMKNYTAFLDLFFVQAELDSFLSRTASAYSFADDIEFRFVDGTDFKIVTIDTEHKEKWRKDGEKLLKVQGYWWRRGLQEFVDDGHCFRQFGQPENQEENRIAYIKAIAIKLKVQEVYGFSDQVEIREGQNVDLFHAALSLELMKAFFQKDYLLEFQKLRKETESGIESLGRLAFEGLIQGFQNRFPFTWSTPNDKAKSMVGWTVSEQEPQGSFKSAQAVNEFLTSDLVELAQQLKKNPVYKPPRLYERTFLKMGQLQVQFPWMMTYQDNTSAIINNLRRLGSTRAAVKDETSRIEANLAEAFEAKGFRVMTGFHPEVTETSNPGEIDLVCIRDKSVIVIEVKSSYLRSSQSEVWQYRTKTLRKAGIQVKRKLESIKSLLTEAPQLFSNNGVPEIATDTSYHGWIVDTCGELDHELFSGYLKVTVDEILIALRDEADWLQTIEDFGHCVPRKEFSLYSDGFSANRFIDVIETGKVWED